MTNEEDRIIKPLDLKILLFYLAIFCVHSCTKAFTKQELYGDWEGKNKEVEIAITFNQNSTCKIVYKEDNSKPITLTGNFEVDFTKRPVPLSIRNIPQLNYPLHTIIQFIELDVIKMAEFAPRWRLRPIVFNRDTEIILKRSKVTPDR